MWTKVKNLRVCGAFKVLARGKIFITELLFPQICFNCKKEGGYLCEDCQSILEVSGIHQKYSTQNLHDLYFALSYKNPLIKNLIQNLKYKPFIKELIKPLSFLIITHFQLLDNKPNFSDFILIPIPLERKKLKWRGFNQAQELGKELASYLKIPLILNCLIKIKETIPQIELSDEKRKENIKNVFSVINNEEQIKNRRILLADDIYTTGSTMEECARVLKRAGAKEVIGIVIARG